MSSAALQTFDERAMPDHVQAAQDGADFAVRSTSAATYASASGTMYFGFTLNEIGVAIGIIATVVTMVANLLFQRRRDLREEELHRQKMQDEARKPA
jgi:type II secretory pathway pseudopilin PulG